MPTGEHQSVAKLVIGPIVRLLILQQWGLCMLTASNAISELVHCVALLAQLQLDRDELDAEKIRKLENGGGPDSSEHARRAMLKLQCLMMQICQQFAVPIPITIDVSAR